MKVRQQHMMIERRWGALTNLSIINYQYFLTPKNSQTCLNRGRTNTVYYKSFPHLLMSFNHTKTLVTSKVLISSVVFCTLLHLDSLRLLVQVSQWLTVKSVFDFRHRRLVHGHTCRAPYSRVPSCGSRILPRVRCNTESGRYHPARPEPPPRLL